MTHKKLNRELYLIYCSNCDRRFLSYDSSLACPTCNNVGNLLKDTFTKIYK